MWLPCGFHATFIRFPCDSRTIFCVSHTSFKRTLATFSCLPLSLFALFSHVASKPTDACCLHNEVIDSSNPCRNRVDTYVHWLQIWVVVLGVFAGLWFQNRADPWLDTIMALWKSPRSPWRALLLRPWTPILMMTPTTKVWVVHEMSAARELQFIACGSWDNFWEIL